MLSVSAPAKVNLFLRVLAREASGFHQIETLFQAVELHDTIRVERRRESGVSLEVEWAGGAAETAGREGSGPGAGIDDRGPVEENLAYRAAVAYRRRAGLEGAPGVAIGLTKVIPAGAGLGGGSSDAAGVLRAMDRIHDGGLAPRALLELAAGLGSDVPFFLGPSSLALGWGRGERLLGLPALEPRPVVVALPPFRISTADAYRRLAGMRSGGGSSGRSTLPNPSAPKEDGVPSGSSPLTLDDLSSWEAVARLAENDFEGVVLPRRPQGRKILERLASDGALPALLSGSGSALFGVFTDPDTADRAATRLTSAVPGVRVYRTATLAGWPELVTS